MQDSPVLLVGGIFPMIMSGEEPGVGTTLLFGLAGNKPEFGKLIALRYLTTHAIALIPFVDFIYWLVNVLFIFGDDRRCIHDRIAGTRVVMAN